MHFTITVRLILFAAATLTIQSCKSYSASFSEYRENEIQYYELKDNATVLDFSLGETVKVAVAGTTANNLHFYLGYAPKRPYNNVKLTKDFFERAKSKLNSHNEARFSAIEEIGDSLLVPSNSFDFVICGDHLYDFNNFSKMASEFKRVLKPKGQLLIVQRQVEKSELSDKELKYLKDSPLPNKESLIPYFRNAGFLFVMSRQVVLNKRMGRVTNGKQTLFRFEKNGGG